MDLIFLKSFTSEANVAFDFSVFASSFILTSTQVSLIAKNLRKKIDAAFYDMKNVFACSDTHLVFA